MIAQFAPNPIRLNWAKGFFCAWAALTVLWILASGWHAYTTTYLRLPFQPQVDCWEPLAKWPDGKSFDEWDRYGAVELDIPSNVEINKKNGEWAADSIAERNRWRESIWQKVKDCQAAKPLVQRIALGVTENWSYLISSLQLILLPPMAVLMASFIFGWTVVRGFRAKQL
jgi:hypothetical protein